MRYSLVAMSSVSLKRTSGYGAAAASRSTAGLNTDLQDELGSMKVSSLAWGLLGGVLQWAWAVFHVLIITLQAFIFSVLTVVYLAQAHDVEEDH